MTKVPADMEVGTIHTSNNYGDFEIVKYGNWKNISIKFLKTGFISVYTSSDIRAGKVKDLLLPTIFGVGYLGEGNEKCSINRKATKAYAVWHNMILRCYNEEWKKNNTTYAMCEVTEEWHNFQNFSKWFSENYIEGYQLDKDIKIEGNKLYSPDTCLFVTHHDNAEKSSARYFKFLSENGETIDVYNLSKFCKDNSLSTSQMSRVNSGEVKSHKGWTKCNTQN